MIVVSAMVYVVVAAYRVWQYFWLFYRSLGNLKPTTSFNRAVFVVSATKSADQAHEAWIMAYCAVIWLDRCRLHSSLLNFQKNARCIHIYRSICIIDKL